MKLTRRTFLHLAAGTAALPAIMRVARAESYPAKPVHLIVGFAPGGAPDILARILGPWLSERLGQPFIVENRPGASTNIATEAVVRSAPDGYMLLITAPPSVINASLYAHLNFNFVRDIAPIAGLMRVPHVMSVNSSLPVRTVPEFISYAKANPGKVNYGSGGNGTGVHMAGELFKMLTGVNMVHIPYRTEADALPNLLGGQLQVMFPTMPASLEYIKVGSLRALAVSTATRSDVLPDVPAVGEFLPGYECSAFYGVGGPKNTPAEIVGRLNKEFGAALAAPKLKAQLADLGGTVLSGLPADFAKLIADETEKWSKVVRSAGIKVE
jgi:tripartite-type tricarboxylate transporter receptor subunit TctC